MKNIPALLKAHYGAEVTTIAHLWQVTRTDGVVLRFTDHDQPITVSGNVYDPTAGFTATAVQTTSALSVDNLNVEGLIALGFVTKEDVLGGLLDKASVTISRCNYASPTDGVEILRKGWLGNVTLTKNGFNAELRGLLQLLQQPVGKAITAECSADLGDSKCTVNVPTSNGTVGAVTTYARAWTDASLTAANDYFQYGVVTWLTGANAGHKMEVKLYWVGVVELQQPMSFPIAVGDTYTISAGCDKMLSTCAGKYANAVNFRGFAHVPGSDFMMSNIKNTRT